MKNIYSCLFFLLLCISAKSQCESVGIQISSSDTTVVQLYHAGFFLIPSGIDNVCEWEVTDFSGAIVHQATTTGVWADQSFSLFNHSVPITDSMKVTLLITNETSGITCFISDTLFWEATEVLPGSFIGNWAVLNDNTGTEITLDLELVDSNDLICFGGSDGTISVLASGGDSPYSFSIDNGPFTASSDFSNLEAGEHIIVVIDNNGNMASLTVDLTGPDELILDISSENVSCFEGINGEVFALASGGTNSNGYKYFINDEGPFTTGLFTDLVAGTYEIIVEDDNACIISETINVSEPDQIVVDNIVLSHLDCFSDSNGSINFEVTGGTSPYTYTYANQDSNMMLPIIGLSAGVYSITVYDQDSCTLLFDFEILAPDTLTLVASDIVNDSCDDDNSGSVTLLGNGGTPDFTYTVNGESNTTGDFSNLSSGEYTATLEDGNGCMIELIFAIGLESDFEVAYVLTNPGCAEDSTGSISILVDGGNQGYTFSLNQVEMPTSEFMNLIAGTYEIQIESSNGCLFTDTVVLNDESTLSLDSVIVGNVNCTLGEYGTIEIIASGGENLMYFLGDQTNSTGMFVDLTEGLYTVSVMDSVGCMDEQQVTISLVGQIIGAIDQLQNISCFGMSDGEVSISVNGATEGYQFQLDSTINTTGVFSNLMPGDYVVVISNAINCISEIGFTIENVEPLVLELIDFVSDDGTGNGSITVEANGGTESYGYSIDGGVTFQSESEFLDLDNDMYTVLVQDANGCLDSLIVLLTSTQEEELGSGISVYPSPTEIGTEFTINSQYIIESILVVNAHGQLVSEKEYNLTNIQVETTEFAEGVYMLGIKTKQGVSWKKVILVN